MMQDGEKQFQALELGFLPQAAFRALVVESGRTHEHSAFPPTPRAVRLVVSSRGPGIIDGSIVPWLLLLGACDRGLLKLSYIITGGDNEAALVCRPHRDMPPGLVLLRIK